EVGQECLVENVALAREGPAVGGGDILLLQFVQLAAQRDVRRNQALAFRWGQRRGVIVGIEGANHHSSQRRAGRRNRSSTACRRSSSLACLSSTAWSSSRMVWATAATCRFATASARARTISASGFSGTIA